MAFCERLRELRIKKNLSQKAAAQGIGVSERAYLAYELGDRTPKVDIAGKIADFYGVSVDYLLGRTPPELELPGADEVEQRVIGTYLRLSEEDRALFRQILDLLAEAARKRQPEKTPYETDDEDKDMN